MGLSEPDAKTGPWPATNPAGFRASPIGNVAGIVADETNRDLVAAALRRQGAHDIVDHGPFTWERRSTTSPPEVGE